ncbi:MAG: flagellar motor switch protein FliN [Planctomycetota bacterium]
MCPTDEIDKLLAEAGLADAPSAPSSTDTSAAPAAVQADSGSDAGEINVDDLLSQLNIGDEPAESSAPSPPAQAPATPPADKPFADVAAASFPAMGDSSAVAPSSNDISLLENVNVKVQVLLGQTKLTVEEILKLGEGSVVELNRLAGEPLDILVNDKLVAQGEVLVLNENFCIRVTDIVPPDERS